MRELYDKLRGQALLQSIIKLLLYYKVGQVIYCKVAHVLPSLALQRYQL